MVKKNKEKNSLDKFFPIHSQTSKEDKIFLLNTIKLLNLSLSTYNYLEIGSYLGGSLTPFIMDKKCKKILSIDKRNLKLSDERGENYDYKNIPEKKMFLNFKKNGLKIDKIRTFNGKIKNLKKRGAKYDLVFIDGEHTDHNCYEDFLYSLNFIKKNSIIIFHDSPVIYKAISLIFIYLNKEKIPYSFIKKSGSLMSAIFFGKYIKMKFNKIYGKIESTKKYFNSSRNFILLSQAHNKLKVKFRWSKFFKRKYPYKYVITETKTKNIKDLDENID